MVLALSGHARAGVRLARSPHVRACRQERTALLPRRSCLHNHRLLTPRLHWDWARPSRIGCGTGLTPVPSARGWTGLTLPKSTLGMRSPLPHLRRNLGMGASAADDRAAFARFLRGFGVHVPCALGRAAPTLRPCRSRGAHVSHVGLASSLVLCNTRGLCGHATERPTGPLRRWQEGRHWKCLNRRQRDRGHYPPPPAGQVRRGPGAPESGSGPWQFSQSKGGPRPLSSWPEGMRRPICQGKGAAWAAITAI